MDIRYCSLFLDGVSFVLCTFYTPLFSHPLRRYKEKQRCQSEIICDGQWSISSTSRCEKSLKFSRSKRASYSSKITWFKSHWKKLRLKVPSNFAGVCSKLLRIVRMHFFNPLLSELPSLWSRASVSCSASFATSFHSPITIGYVRFWCRRSFAVRPSTVLRLNQDVLYVRLSADPV